MARKTGFQTVEGTIKNLVIGTGKTPFATFTVVTKIPGTKAEWPNVDAAKAVLGEAIVSTLKPRANGSVVFKAADKIEETPVVAFADSVAELKTVGNKGRVRVSGVRAKIDLRTEKGVLGIKARKVDVVQKGEDLPAPQSNAPAAPTADSLDASIDAVFGDI